MLGQLKYRDNFTFSYPLYKQVSNPGHCEPRLLTPRFKDHGHRGGVLVPPCAKQ